MAAAAHQSRYRDGEVAVRPAAGRWQTLQSIDTGRLLLLSATALIVAFCVAQLVDIDQSSQAAIAFGLFIAFGELLRLALPGGREAAPIAMTAALALAMSLAIAKVNGPHVLMISPGQVVGVAALGMALGALPHIAAGRPAGATGMSARLLAVALVAFIFRPMASFIWSTRDALVQFGVMAVLAAMAWLLKTVITAIIRAEDLRAKYLVTFVDEVRVQWRLGLAVGISAIITVFGATVMGLDELAVFAGPLFVIQLAFRRYAGIRATYLQTVRALAQVTEVAGYVDSGHSRRVSKVALAVGRELGMPEPKLLHLEYAALMHDIGQLSLVEPVRAGATVDVSPAEARRIAEFGAEVISQTGMLDEVADIVRFQWLPYRGDTIRPPLASRIIRVVNAFDDQVAGSADRDRIASAMASLHAQTENEYDPDVVSALATVTNRLPISRL
jgi:hypothetical protein